MNILKLVTSAVGSTKPGHNFNHLLAPESGAGFFERIKAVTRIKLEQYKSQVREENETQQVLHMSDSMLKDIGMTQGDRDSLKCGLTSLEELNARREAYYGQLYGENR